jgi:tetratricopeptide (TPR) repeat protein
MPTIDELFNRQQQAAEKDLRRHPNNIHLLTNAGVSYLNAGDLETAKSYFEQALQQNPLFIKAQLNLAKVHHLQGNLKKAIEIYVTLQQLHTNNALVIENLVSLYIEKGEDESCWPLLEKLIQIEPDKPSGYFLTAILHLTRGQIEDVKDAVRALRKVIQLGIHHADIHNCLGVCYAILGSLKKAIRSFQTALTIAPEDREATLNLVQAYEQANRLSDSLTLLDAYVERHERDGEARDLLARAFFFTGDYKKSLFHLLLIETQVLRGSVSSQNDDLIRLDNNLAVVYARLGEVGKARESYERCIKEQPEKSSVYFNFAMFLLDLRQFQHADEVIADMAAKFPDDSTVTLLKGRCFLEREQFDDAVDYLQQAVKLRPNDILAPCFLGWIYSEIRQDYQAAISLFKEALTHHPTDARLLNNLAYNHLMADEVEVAREVLDQANERESPIFLTATRGFLLIKEGNILEGKRLYNKAAKMASNEELRGQIHQKKFLELARYELKQKNPGQAVKYLNEAIKHQSNRSVFQQQAHVMRQKIRSTT